MEIYVDGETIPYTYKTQVDKKGIVRRYCRANIIVSIDPISGTHVKKEITAPNKEYLQSKIRTVQRTRSLNDASILPFQQYIEDWMKRNEYRLNPNTVRTYWVHIRKHILPYIGSVKMADFDEDLLAAYFKKLIEDYNESVANKVKCLLSIPMREAAERYLTYGNPLSHIKIPQYQTKPIVPLTKSEAQQLICLCRKSPCGGQIALALDLGLRISEDIGLSIDAVDIPHRLIHIRRQINDINGKYILQNHTKNHKERILYMDDLCLEFIKRELEKQEQNRLLAGDKWNNQYNCLFTTENGSFVKHKDLRKQFKALAAEIGRPELKFHHLRHTAATIVSEETHDISAAKEMLGHSHYSTTGRYIHSSEEKLKTAAISISNYLTS